MLNNDGPEVLRFLQRALQLVRQLNGGIGEASLARNGLTFHEYLVLRIALLGFDRPSAIADRLHLPAPVVARAIAGLHRAGLVTVEDDPDDRRRRQVRVTAAGRARHDQTRIDAAALFEAAHPDLDPAVLRTAVDAVEALWAAIGTDEGYADDPARPRPSSRRGGASEAQPG